VSATPSSFNLTAGSEQLVTLSATSSAVETTSTITFNGASGSLSHSTQLSVSVLYPVTGMHSPLRTRYIRTNSYYDPNVLQAAPPHFTVYDPARKQFFVSNPYMNVIDVFDAKLEVEITTIPVPLAWGIDISPITGNLYAGTLEGDVYEFNTGTYALIERYPSASIGPNGYVATEAFVLSDGRLALLGSQGGILGVDGASSAVVWDPTTNALDTGANGSICTVGGIGGFSVSGDRTRILVTTIDESGTEPVCSYDPNAQQATYGSFPYGTFVKQIIPSPDGSRFYLTSNLNGIGVFDAKTVEMLGQISTGESLGAVVSLDGKTLYSMDNSYELNAFDTTSLSQVGWLPIFTIGDMQGVPVVSAIDSTGLIVGPLGHGVGFLDATLITASETTRMSSSYITPNTGPVTGGTVVYSDNSYGITPATATLSKFYVGNAPGLDATLSTATTNPNGEVTTPPSTVSGPVDLSILMSDGGVGIAPEAFSFGPTILEVVPNGATADGGQTGTIIGYGFGTTTSGIQITLGGSAAPVTAIHSTPPLEPYPFPVEGVQFTIPAGSAGSTVDVTVTTSSGTATAKSAFTYTAAAQSFTNSAALQAGIYDAGRGRYYFTSQSQIQVLSGTGGWLTSISLPGTTSASNFSAIAESQDGTKLAVSDYGGQAIYVLNPDNPAGVTRYPMPLFFTENIYAPSGLTVTNGGLIYFATGDLGGTGTSAFHALDTSTGVFTILGSFQSGGGDFDDRILLSPDGSHLYGNIERQCFWFNTANTASIYTASESSYDLAVSADGSTVDAGGNLTDPSLNYETSPAYIDWETWLPTAVWGQKLSADGSLLFQPLTDGIDVIARNTGRLLYRIQIPGTVANVYDALVSIPGKNAFAVITTTGVSIVDLSSLSIPSGVVQPFPNAIGRSLHEYVRASASAPNHSTAVWLNGLKRRPQLKHSLSSMRTVVAK